MVQNIIFDFGGVVVTLDHDDAVKRFTALGLKNAGETLNPYTQGGIFGDLELGKISAGEFVEKLSSLCGKQLTHNDCKHAWLGYCKEIPERNLKMLRKLRNEGYRLILLSNTNPFMMEWANSKDFSNDGHSVSDYFDKVYLSYEMGLMKPDPSMFVEVLAQEQILPSHTLFVDDGARNVAAASQLGINTFCPLNGSDWTSQIHRFLGKEIVFNV